MNQALLTRLFKSIDGDQNTSLLKVAYNIIEEERRKGHTSLAEKLNTILQSSLVKPREFKAILKVR
ncbi:MAG: hypothetical protein ABIO60_09285 [Aquaticitalea sp.]